MATRRKPLPVNRKISRTRCSWCGSKGKPHSAACPVGERYQEVQRQGGRPYPGIPKRSNPLARAIPAKLIPDGKGGYRVFVNAKRAGMQVRNPEGMRKGLGSMYELFYSYGGHGGPYSSLTEARQWARNLLRGDPHHLKWVKIKRYSHRGVGGFGATVDTIHQKESR